MTLSKRQAWRVFNAGARATGAELHDEHWRAIRARFREWYESYLVEQERKNARSSTSRAVLTYRSLDGERLRLTVTSDDGSRLSVAGDGEGQSPGGEDGGSDR